MLRRFTVSSLKTSRTAGGAAIVGARAKDVAAKAVPMGKRAGATAVQGVRHGVRDAREWAAPRLEDAAGAVTASVAPRVASVLRSAARQVQPEASRPARTGLRTMLSWRWLAGLGAAAVAAAGAAAALAMRRRYASATAEVHDDAESPDGESAPEHEAADDTARSEANGKVGKSRR
jgi:hypothetical protein